MSAPNTDRRVLISAAVVRETETLLSPHDSLETAVYWFGRVTDTEAYVLTAIRPAQIRTWGSFEVSARANADVTAFACEHGLRLIAQLHSHPGRYVGHSPGDDMGAPFVFPGFLSIVVPLYGIYGVLPLTKCGVHVYRNGFDRLTPAQIKNTFQIIPHVDDQH